jgi:hypothetical protein
LSFQSRITSSSLTKKSCAVLAQAMLNESCSQSTVDATSSSPVLDESRHTEAHRVLLMNLRPATWCHKLIIDNLSYPRKNPFLTAGCNDDWKDDCSEFKRLYRTLSSSLEREPIPLERWSRSLSEVLGTGSLGQSGFWLLLLTYVTNLQNLIDDLRLSPNRS